MKKITKPCKVNEKKYMFTEGINYFKTGKKSIWGEEDRDTLEVLGKEKLHGKWLHLAAGDGRYNVELLRKVDSLTTTDIDASALSKLWHNTPKKYQSKLKIKVFNLIDKFPFENESFDGVFSVGILHLFPKKILKKMFSEIDRVLKPDGRAIFDFVTDAKRTKLSTGEPYVIKTRANYTLKEAKIFLKNILKNYTIRIYESEVSDEEYREANPAYKLNCKFILLVADRLKK